MLISSENIASVIPQREPFIMVDNLLSDNGTTARSNFLIKPDNIFCKSGVFHTPGIIENVAQTAAARMGYKSLIEQKEVPVGFIGAIKDLTIYNLPKSNTIINTEITITYEVFNATIIKGIVKNDDGLIAECEMKIFLENSQK